MPHICKKRFSSWPRVNFFKSLLLLLWIFQLGLQKHWSTQTDKWTHTKNPFLLFLLRCSQHLHCRVFLLLDAKEPIRHEHFSFYSERRRQNCFPQQIAQDLCYSPEKWLDHGTKQLAVPYCVDKSVRLHLAPPAPCSAGNNSSLYIRHDEKWIWQKGNFVCNECNFQR